MTAITKPNTIDGTATGDTPYSAAIDKNEANITDLYSHLFAKTIGQYSSSLNTAVTSIGSTKATLIIDETVTLTASTTVPSTLHLLFTRDGKVTLGAYTLTVNGPLTAPISQIFNQNSTGRVVFGNGYIERVIPNWWGADPTGATASTAALQAAFNVAAKAKIGKVFIPAGYYTFTKLYLHYHATNNPDWPSDGQYALGRLIIEGAGSCDVYAYANDWLWGTILESTDGTGPGIFADGSGAQNRADRLKFRDIMLVADNTTYVLNLTSAPRWTGLENVVIYQKALAGGGVYHDVSWFTSYKDVLIENENTSSCTGIGIHIDSATTNGGGPEIDNMQVHYFGTGYKFGHADVDSGNGLSHLSLNHCEANDCEDIGLYFGSAVTNANVRNLTVEGCPIGVQIASGARGIVINGKILNHTTAGVQLGQSTGHANNPVHNIVLDNCILDGQNDTVKHVCYWYDADSDNVTIRDCWFDGHASATDTGIWLEDQEYTNLHAVRNMFESTVTTDCNYKNHCQTFSEPGYSEVNAKETSWRVERDHGEYLLLNSRTEQLTLSGASTTWSSAAIPNGAVILGLVGRVTTAVTGCTSFDVGDGSDQDIFADGVAIAVDTQFGVGNASDNGANLPRAYNPATSIVVTAVGGSFSGGVVRLTIYYFMLNRPDD